MQSLKWHLELRARVKARNDEEHRVMIKLKSGDREQALKQIHTMIDLFMIACRTNDRRFFNRYMSDIYNEDGMHFDQFVLVGSDGSRRSFWPSLDIFVVRQ